MQPILNAKQISQVDQLTIEREPITSIKLMQRAAHKCAAWIADRFSREVPIIVFCGIGNNGGDGLVIAHELLDKGYSVRIYVVRFSKSESEDFKFYFDRLQEKHKLPKDIAESKDVPFIDSDTVVVDAIFGNGLSRPAEGIAQECIEVVNSSKSTVVSIDMPSGLFADQLLESGSACVKAWTTLTFQLPKLSLLLPNTGKYSRHLEVIDIGLDQLAINQQETDDYYIQDISEYREFFNRGRFTHKGSFGHVLVVAGKYGSMGAAILCTEACVHSGAGLVTAAIPRMGMDIIQIGVPDAMAIETGVGHTSRVPELDSYAVVVAGPGLGQHEETESVLLELVKSCKLPMVIDADALNILSRHPQMLEALPKNSVLTPHPKEFERLFGKAESDFERITRLKQKAAELNVTIVLKGAHTAVAVPSGKVHYNSTGNSGLATGGSGDVLSGIIAGLLAQCQNAEMSAICGVYLHGLAADLAIETKSPHSLAASDLMSTFGQAMKMALKL